MCVTVTAAKLYQAQPVASGLQPHGFGVNGDRVAQIEIGEQVALVEVNGHGLVPFAV